MDESEKQRTVALVDAGYNPLNHPNWMTVQELGERKAEMHKEHQKFLDQYRK